MQPNTLFPGRPNYTGPTAGYFALLHHSQLWEKSRNVLERVAYVQKEKPAHERAIRLHNMLFLPFVTDKEYDAYEAKRKPLYDNYWAKLKLLNDNYDAKRNPLEDDYETKSKPLDKEVLAFIKQHIPECPWNGEELVFTHLVSSKSTHPIT